jgi:hypothetical protein
MTFASVVLAIALSELLGGWGRLIRSGLPIRWSGLWIGYSLAVVSIIIMYWSGMWPYRDQSFREGYKIYWLAIPTFFLVVLGYLLSPEPDDDANEVDLEARYWQISSRMFPLLALTFLGSVLADVMIMGEPRVSPALPDRGAFTIPTQAVALSVIVSAGFIKKPWLHWATLGLMILPTIRYLFGDFTVFR